MCTHGDEPRIMATEEESGVSAFWIIGTAIALIAMGVAFYLWP